MQALSAQQVIFRIIVIVSVAELAIMLMLGSLEHDHGFLSVAILDTALLVCLSGPAIYYWIIMPFIKAHARILAQVNQLALTDQLTNISNRRQLMQVLSSSIANRKRHNKYDALLLLDMNRFKPVNDNYGHEAGDALLIEVAQRLKRVVREVDTVGRLGGDEFVILLSQLGREKQTSLNELGHITQRIITELKIPYIYNGKHLPVSVSIGITLVDHESDDIEEILRQADEAMYQAKNTGQDFAVNVYQ